ncbi:MAG: hypothetical protein WBF07_02435, partial [Xanthobacteraceae bacterium]
MLVADGQPIDSVEAAKLPAGQYGSDAWGGVYFSQPLTAYFGKDLKGLVSVRDLKIVVSMAGVNTTIYEVNLSGTDEMFQNFPQVRDVIPTPHQSELAIYGKDVMERTSLR